MDFDDTLINLTNFEEIAKITSIKCISKDSKSNIKPKRNWSALSLSSQKSRDFTVRENVLEEFLQSEQKPQSLKDVENITDNNQDSFAFLVTNNVKAGTSKQPDIDDFSQFCNSTKVVRQLDEDIQREEERHNLSNENVYKKRKSLESDDALFKQPKISISSPLKETGAFNFLFEDSQHSNKVVKTEPVSKFELDNTFDYSRHVSSNQVTEESGVENTLTHLLKSSQYRKQLTQLFENVEQSICHFGSKDQNQSSFMNDDFLSKFTQDGDTSIGAVIKKALKDNVNKSLTIKNLTNSTILSAEPIFQELGTFYGLSNKVEELIKRLKGIDELYDWQSECLNLPSIKQRKNLIYSLPTSGGKTLVAEILILREVLCRKRNAIFVLPYVSIVQEKVWALSSFAVELDFLVEEYAAGKGTYPPRKRRHKNCVYVATTEKALGLVNSLIEKERLNEIGLMVVDEMHLIGDCQRGSTLEVLLTKLMFLRADIQIVGMSATIGNLSDISKFLNADVYTRNFRPVELTEYIKCGNKIAKINLNADENSIFEVCRRVNFDYTQKMVQADPDRIGGLVMEVIPKGSCLVFCPTKKNCENVTKLLCRVVKNDLKAFKVKEKMQLLHALKHDAGTICNILKESVPFGIAYHHSGLIAEERKLIEESYRTGILCVICCTSTLAAGVNLPAKRVIIRKPYIAQDFINLSRYKQMIGRAGRAGLGEVGESILICNAEELSKLKELFLAPMDPTMSKLLEADYTHLMHLFLSCISLGTANTKGKLKEVLNKSLLAVQQEKLDVQIENVIRKVIHDLNKLGAIGVECSNNLNVSSCTVTLESGRRRVFTIDSKTKLVITKLGKAATKGNLNMRDAHLLYDDLTKAKDCLVLVNCLHLLYLVTPYHLVELIKPDMNQFHYIMTQLGSEERKTANILGITESCVVRMLSNQKIKSVPENVLNRFYMSLMLYELWNGGTVVDVAEKYQVNRGIVQNLMSNAATFATNVVMFCEQLEEFWAFVCLLKGMSQRLAHCSCKELLPLMELPAVKQVRAKQLYQAGFKNLQSIAKADPSDLIQAVEFMSRKIANQLIAAAKMLLLEKVENLREEAEDVLDGIDEL